MEFLAWELHSLLRGRFHYHGIVVTRGTLRTRNHLHGREALMLLMTNRTGAILHDARFMKRVLLMAALAFPIDGSEGESVMRRIPYQQSKLSQRWRPQRFLVAACAIGAKSCVIR